MNILILGSGTVGSVLYSYLKQWFSIENLNRNNLDAEQLDKITINFKQYDYVINCIGITKAVTNRTENKDDLFKTQFLVNGIFPIWLSERCKRLIHLSTDYVFKGDWIDHKYLESDRTDALGQHELSKRIGDMLENGMVLRTSMPGPGGKSNNTIFNQLLNTENEIFYGFINWYWNGITSLQFADCVRQIIENDLYDKGLYHLFSPHDMTKYEFCCMIKDVFKLKVKIKPRVSTKYFNTMLKSEKFLQYKLLIPDMITQLENLKLFMDYK